MKLLATLILKCCIIARLTEYRIHSDPKTGLLLTGREGSVTTGFTKHMRHFATSRRPDLKGKQCIILLGPGSVNGGNVCAAGQGFKRHDSWQISVKDGVMKLL